ncbi:tetratricopeptide repeat protein [Ideonella sp. A 288]|uniref:tetratricopeptide repeat protein n=1 Tax=Ideonella sp. A 288 TaxID=1962181 RepID=UPI000B4A8453|nr:tetratricopeptide repeat protein [Ideonella sp. A 288]
MLRLALGGGTVALMVACAAPRAAVDVAALWDYARPAESEQRFRAALAGAGGDEALVLRTQIARTLGLRGRFDEAFAELDAIEPLLAAAGAEPQVRALLERGRTLRSSGRPAEAKPLFERAFARAQASSLQALAADALHMEALVAPGLEAQLAANRRVLAYARAATDPQARAWDAAAWHNMGVALNDAGRHADALDAYQQALATYRAQGRADRVHVARWMVAHTLRLLGRLDEALAAQQALARSLAESGRSDRYVHDELAILQRAMGRPDEAARQEALRDSLR